MTPADSIPARTLRLPFPLPAAWPVLAVFAFLLLEAVALANWLDVLADLPVLAGSLGNWRSSARHFGLALMTAGAGFLWLRSRSGYVDLFRPSIAWRLLAAHFLAALGLFAYSRALIGMPAHSARTEYLIAGWLSLALCWFCCGLFAAVFPARLLTLLRTGWAAVAGTVALAVALAVVTQYQAAIWDWTSALTLWGVKGLITLVLPNVTTGPVLHEIGSDSFRVIVGWSCSGIGGIALIVLFGIVWLACFRNDWRFPNALLVIPFAVVLSWCLNCVRIAALILIGHYGAPDIADGGFHSQAGWIAFNLVALVAFGTVRKIAWFRPVGQLNTAVPLAANPAAPFLIPFLAILVAAMFSGAMAANGFEPFYLLRFLAVAGCLVWMRRAYRSLDWRFGWPAVLAGVVVFVLWMLVARKGGPSDIPAGLASLAPWQAAGWLAIRTVASSVTVPIAEELAFRGFLLRFLVARDFESVSFRAWTPLALIASSLAFGLMHGDQWIGGTLAGLLYAAAMLRRGRIGEAVAAHGITNALIAAWVLYTGEWSLW